MKVLFLIGFVFQTEAASAPPPTRQGNCGYQCKADSECSGCGHAGVCSCPDAKLSFVDPRISCSCTSRPAGAPDTKAVPINVNDSVWPQTWTGLVESWTYGDFSNKTSIAKGKFFYDGTTGHSRADWKPYINGKAATQVWITDMKKGTSRYFVKAGHICISFGITDPGNKQPVGLTRADWMKNCYESGIARYVGREEVMVAQASVWADHWAAHLEYEEVNQSITFQNWHSLGLNGIPKGLPLRVTGGNSHPNPTRGSPRLNTVWYSQFDGSPIDQSVFEKPALICIPVGEERVEQHFGFQPTQLNVFDHNFHVSAQELLDMYAEEQLVV